MFRKTPTKHDLKGKAGGLWSGIWREAPLAQLHTTSLWSQDLSIHKPSQLPGSTQPGCRFGRTELFKHTSLHCPTRYPFTPGSTECTCRQSALPWSTTSQHSSAQWGSNPRYLGCKSRTLWLSHDAPLYTDLLGSY